MRSTTIKRIHLDLDKSLEKLAKNLSKQYGIEISQTKASKIAADILNNKQIIIKGKRINKRKTIIEVII